ncbi:hypothetical protein Q7P35_000153 [Cladosporium inversicolor]
MAAAMDETTFQKELRELKHCVADIANSPSPAFSAAQLSNYMSANAVHNDLFVAQLCDVRTRLDIMQSSLLQHGRDQMTEAPRQRQSEPDHRDSSAFDDLALNVHALQDTILRCHRDTNDRIDRLEQAISRLDGPIIYTPPSSETTLEDLTASQEASAGEATGLPEPNSAVSEHDLPGQQDGLDRPATLSELLEESWTEHDDVPQPFMAICPPKLDQRSGLPNLSDILNDSTTLGKLHDLCDNSTVYQFEATPTVDEALRDDLPMSRLNAINTHQPEMGWVQDTILQQTTKFEDSLAVKDAVIAHLKTCRAAAEEASQITRTDLENRLAENEAQLARWRDEAEAAQRGFEAMARCNRELQDARDHAIGRLKQDLKQCEESRHHFMTKYVDENYRFKWLEQRKMQSEQRLYQQLDECERALENSERNRDADIREAVRNRDDDLEQLYAFCREKNDVVSYQEQIIAQGTSILHERDAEIDELNIALAESQRGREYDQGQAGKFKRVIHKREDEIDDLKRKIKDERDRRHRLEDSLKRDADAKRNKAKDVRFDVEERRPSRQSQPSAQSNETEDRRQTLRRQASWTPQPIPLSRFCQEEDRAALWQNGARSAPDHRFGSASPITRRRKPDTRHGMASDHSARDNEEVHAQPSASFNPGSHMTPHNQPNSSVAIPFDQAASQFTTRSSDGRRHNSSQRTWRLPEPRMARQEAHVDASDSQVTGGRSGMEAQRTANSGTAENRRHALPLDATWLPPLPARASASKVRSVPNMRAGSHQPRFDDVGAISKPASMLELRPQSYAPPSVETEAESAEDQGGSSLVDC